MTSSPPSPSAAPEPPDHRDRLLDGLARAVAAKGYALTTIADIVAEAAVSRRTFYEHFNDKAACFVALYERSGAQGLTVLRKALDATQPWSHQLDQALSAYFGWMAGNPALIRAMFIEILALGPDGLAARRRSQNQLAEFMLATANRHHTRKAPIHRTVALAIIGAIHELVLDRLEAGDPEGVKQIAPVAGDLVRQLLGDAG